MVDARRADGTHAASALPALFRRRHRGLRAREALGNHDAAGRMMVTSPRFLGPLEVRKLAGGRWWLLRDLAYDSAVAQARIVVPAEFVTDFASVPRLPFAYWFTGNTGHGAAVIHDWLYQHPASGDRRLADAARPPAPAGPPPPPAPPHPPPSR